MAPMNSGGPTVSIILATNRGRPYLQETLASVAAQSFRDWELIVVDDGSDEPEVIRQAVDGWTNAFIVRQDNAGSSVARNVGFAHSSGEFIVYLDDDDVWHPDRLAQQVEALRGDETALSCHSGYWFIDGGGQRFGTDVTVHPASTDEYLSGDIDSPRIQTLMLRRQVIERSGGLLSNFKLYEDCEFILRAVREGPVVSLPEHLVGWRIYPESVSFTHSSRVMNSAAVHAVMIGLWGAQTREDHAEADLLSRNIEHARHRFAQYHASEFCHLVRTGHWRDALPELAEGLHNSPVTVLRKCVDIALRRDDRALM